MANGVTAEAAQQRVAAREETSESTHHMALLRILLFAALGLSVAASSGPIQWMDNGWLLLAASQGAYFADHLYATYHPLYQMVTVLLFKLFGPWSVAYFNNVLMIPIAYVTYRLSRTLGLHTAYAAMSALAVVLLQDVFWVSTKMEVYALHLLLTLATYWLVFEEAWTIRHDVKIFLVGVLTGLGVATNQLTFVVLFPLYLFLLRQSGWSIVYAIPGFVVGAFSCYPAMLNDVLSGRSLWTAIRLFMTGSDGLAPIGWESALLRFDKVVADKAYVALVLVSLCGIGLLGLLPPSTGPQMRVLWWAATLNLLFAVSYGINDRFTFFLPGAAFYAILGVAWVSRRSAEFSWARSLTLTLILVHPLILTSTALLASTGWITLPAHPSKLPFRDDTKYYLSPYLPDTSAATFVRAYEQQVPEGSAVLADYTPMGALRSAQVIGLFLHRELIQCDENGLTDEHRQRWPARMYLVRKSYCEDGMNPYRAEPLAIGWVLSK